MANPVRVLVTTYLAGACTSESVFATFTFVLTSDFEANIPVIIRTPATTGMSAGAEVNVYRSNDQGATYETDGSFVAAFSKPTAASQVQRRSIRLTTGYWIISVCTGGGGAAGNSTFSVMLGTAEVISAYA